MAGRFETSLRAENAAARNINTFYNPSTAHSSLGFNRPIAFERKATKGKPKAFPQSQTNPRHPCIDAAHLRCEKPTIKKGQAQP